MLTHHVLDESQIRAIYGRIKENFPPDECRPLRMMLSLMRKGLYEALCFCDGGEPVGYALSLLPKACRAVLLDYLVVVPERRGQGVGTAILAQLQAHYAVRADAIFIESEDPDHAPDHAQAARRLRFYDSAGAVCLPFRMLLFGVDYAILALPASPPLPDADWSAILLTIYRQTLPPLLYKTQVRLLPTQTGSK